MAFRTFFCVFTYVLIALASRFLPHWPNFTAMNAMALMSGFTLGCPLLSFWCVCAVSIATDCFFGFYQGMPFVYLSYGLIAFLGSRMQKNDPWFNKVASVLASSSIFFFLSNFGAWRYTGLYTSSWEGFVECYLAAIPFFANQFLGDLAFGAVMMRIFLAINRQIGYDSLPLHR